MAARARAAATATAIVHPRCCILARWFLFAATLALAIPATAATRYVNLNNSTPAAPYTSWNTAATNIQNAVDAAVAGDLILITNGVYRTEARAVYGMSNRVAVTKPVTVQSVNGPAVTTIAGYRVPGTINGAAAVRCVYLTNGAVLAGFTLTNGATQTSGDFNANQSGGGVWCESASGVVTNCTLTGNSAIYAGGGASSGTLNNCALTGNSAQYGGGAYAFTLNNCTLTGNSAFYGGGGAYGGTLNNCTLTGNSAFYGGGGAYGGTLNNCTLTGNSATRTSGSGGGAWFGTLNNCIVYYNKAPNGPNNYDSAFNYCCTTPLPSGGSGNLNNTPLFVNTNAWTNLRLRSNSPCINAGNNAYVAGATDLDDRPRIASGRVDMGAYEYSAEFPPEYLGWLQSHGLATDGSADFTDPDSDWLNNWQEWTADTDPGDAASCLRVQATTSGPTGIAVSFLSSASRLYTLYFTTELTSGVWTPVPGQTDLPGNGGILPLTDSTVGPARFYRVGVRLP